VILVVYRLLPRNKQILFRLSLCSFGHCLFTFISPLLPESSFAGVPKEIDSPAGKLSKMLKASSISENLLIHLQQRQRISKTVTGVQAWDNFTEYLQIKCLRNTNDN